MSSKPSRQDCNRCIESLKSELLIELSHEFRTPLTLILGPLADVRTGRGGELPATALELIELAWHNAERLRGIINRILDTSRLDGEPSRVADIVPWRPPVPLPARPASATVSPCPAPLTEEAADRTTILVVDDQPEIRTFVRGHLEPKYRVEEADDGALALARARDLLPDLVVSDVMMPNMDGLALCRALKQDPELDWVPVVLLTARAAADDRLEGLCLGADDYLTKPFDARELKVRVDNLITSRRRLREHLVDMGADSRPRPRLPLAPGVQPVNGDREWLERVRDTIEAELGDDDFTVEALATALAVHRSQLHRRLKQLTGKAPLQLIGHLRLARAAALLETEPASVSEIAYAVGFRSVAHFSHRFSEQYGSSPSAWRVR